MIALRGEPASGYERNVFINCPFDDAYKPILNAMVFCVVRLGFRPRLATERIDSGETRISKIIELISGSRFGIHDLSRSQARRAHELSRHNMPLELGIDLGVRACGDDHHRRKVHLVLEEKAYRHQAAISDLSNSDLAIHGGEAKTALQAVRDFLAPHRDGRTDGATALWGQFNDFQARLYLDLTADGFSDAETRTLRPTEYIQRIRDWLETAP